MPRRRRSQGRIRLGIRVAAIVRNGREARAWTKTDLSERSGISRQMIAAVESSAANPSLDVVAALFDGLEMEVELVAKGPVRIDDRRRTDAGHALCSAYVQRRLEAAGWLVAREVRIESGRYLGWIDLLAYDERSGTLLVIEIKTRIDDVGSIERSMDWHLREAVRAAARLGWHPRRSAGWLLALASDEVDEALRRNRSIWDATFPLRAPILSALIAGPDAAPTDRGVALIDPRSRRRTWLIRARIDGRRSPAPYRGYADLLMRTRAR